MVTDCISGQPLPAEQAYYLLNSLVSVCCRPSILSFSSVEQVNNFRLGFGGTPARLQEALDFLVLEEKLSSMQRT